MGSDQSAPVVRYKKELLKLSWRLVLTVQKDADAKSKAETLDVETKSQFSSISGKEVVHVRPFHEDFETQFFKYCPDLQQKFPTDFALVSKMIQSFISTAIESKSIGKLAKKFAKNHKKYNLSNEHFEGFAQALVDTLQTRLASFGTIELMKIWRETTNAIVKEMQKSYLASKKYSSSTSQHVPNEKGYYHNSTAKCKRSMSKGKPQSGYSSQMSSQQSSVVRG
mmetsp:Transcript_10682/g.15931  ORF Transcript_10682/g.15931 Transcript_10682/m.15931 type:complete len:224 (-) Transcript_10682:87-758(-)